MDLMTYSLAFLSSLVRMELEQIIEIKLNEEESDALKKSADAVKKLCQGISYLSLEGGP